MVELRSDIAVEYIQHMGDDEIIAKAARVSTGKDQEDNDKIKGLIGYLSREEHTSPFEHTGLTIRFEAPIFVHRQVMTHRIMSKNTESGRYTEFKPEFYVPGAGRPLVNAGSGAHPNLVSGDPYLLPTAYTYHIDAYDAAWTAYQGMLEEGIATEVARDVLPVGTYTSWYMTGNLFAWFQFLGNRDGSKGHPQDEIATLAQQVWPIIEEHWPIAAKAWKEKNG